MGQGGHSKRKQSCAENNACQAVSIRAGIAETTVVTRGNPHYLVPPGWGNFCSSFRGTKKRSRWQEVEFATGASRVVRRLLPTP